MMQPAARDPQSGAVTPGRLEQKALPVPELGPGEVLVQVAGCGICHTDLGFFYNAVPTVQKPPLTLGHEISGTVVVGDSAWIGKEVLVPAVMPCRRCQLCKTRRVNRCLAQRMPGNSLGLCGGFSSHIPVPSIDLCEIKRRGDLPLAHLAVVAIDIVDARLEKMKKYGADLVINAKGKSDKEMAATFKEIRKQAGLPGWGWKIFEATGTRPGQETALNLLGFTGKLIAMGFGMHKVGYSISRLMAFDAEIIGTWGCLPEYYPQVLELVLSGKIAIEPFVQSRPMSSIAEAFAEAHQTPPERRIVLVPEF